MPWGSIVRHSYVLVNRYAYDLVPIFWNAGNLVFLDNKKPAEAGFSGGACRAGDYIRSISA